MACSIPVPPIAVGDPNPYPYHALTTLIEDKDWIGLAKSEPQKQAVFMEKLDGSNFSVASDGLVCSRRQVLLTAPHDKTAMSKIKFMNFKLTFAEPYLASIDKLHKEIQEWFPDDRIVVIMYGELILQGTASGKSDIFDYANKKGERNDAFKVGHVYSYSIGLHFPDLIQADTLEAKKQKIIRLEYGVKLAAPKREHGKRIFYFIMNDKLKELLDKHGFETYPHQTGTFTKLFAEIQDDLRNPGRMEGYVIIFPQDGLIYKIKGVYETFFEQRLKKFDSVRQELESNGMANLSELLERTVDKSRELENEKRLEKIVESAINKFPLLLESNHPKEIYIQKIDDEIKRSNDLEGIGWDTLSKLKKMILAGVLDEKTNGTGKKMKRKV